MRWEIKEARIPSRSEIKALIRTLRERSDAARINGNRQAVVDWMAVHALIGSGLRSHEIAALQVGDLKVGYGEAALVVRKGKGGKSRVVAISERLKHHLKQYISWKKAQGETIDTAAPLLRSERDGPYCTRGIRHLFKRCLKRAGISAAYGVHSLRHFHLSNLYEQTNDLRLVQDQAGHSSVAVTQVYTHVSLGRRQQAVETIFS